MSDSETPRISTQELSLKSLENVHEPIDLRLKGVPRPSQEQLDEGLTRQFSHLIEHRRHADKYEDGEKQTVIMDEEEPEPVYVEFKAGDERNPIAYPNSLKWKITLVGCAFTILSASTGSSYNLGFGSMTKDLNCSEFQATIGLSMYALGFGIVPLFSSSFSEEVGRRPLYIVCLLGHTLMHLMIALSHNIQTVIVARFLQGAFGSTGAVMVGGTIADIWQPSERSLPMSIYALCAVGGTGLGPIYAGWIEMNSHLQWRWIQWVHMIATFVVWVSTILFMKETRSTILLIRLAKKMRKETGDLKYRARAEDEGASLRTLIFISCTRPLYLLTHEPTVIAISIWVGFAWGMLYCMIESVGPVFQSLHGFNAGQEGTAFVTVALGSLLGFMTNFYQERLYQRNFARRGPEARLYGPCIAAIFFPIGMFIYAWCAFASVPWIALAIGITVFIWALFTIYLAAFTYLADCYGPFASSASAGQSLTRNIMATVFPLFTSKMFAALTYKWGNTVFGVIATLMVPIPFILFHYGPRIRARSKFASMVLESQKL
ncbi:MFS general substrate transporter [Athelia psychrophila]|uniref:MFS general substrate transporter n=1 Tax=Athelia psychrophila TaxID=1759441 RepID=A0A166TCY0_9AGAM|nr:MFS general substrate transporter [Fibularhizoctonia sp. CBS 109695]